MLTWNGAPAVARGGGQPRAVGRNSEFTLNSQQSWGNILGRKVPGVGHSQAWGKGGDPLEELRRSLVLL